MSEVTQHQIEGVCTGVMSRDEWKEFHIDIGKQYPVKLSSKQPAVKEAAEAAGKQKAVWSYSQRDGKENPHQPGTFFKNRYLESVVVGGTLDPALAQQDQTHQNDGGSTQQQQGPSTDGREQSIERQSLIKAAVPLLALGGDWSEDKFFAFIDRLDDWMGRNRAQPDTPEAAEAQPEPGPDDGDDIPF